MAARQNTEPTNNPPKRRKPATTLEGRESQLVSAAIDLAEKQIHEGTASAQVISHFLKLGSSRERLEQARLAKENEMIQAKIDAIASQQDVAEMYDNAMKAMSRYTGQASADDYYD